MKKQFVSKRAALAAFALLCCGVFFINSNARAQCPGSSGPAPNPSIYPWIYDSLNYSVGSNGCDAWIYFCYRQIPGTPSDSTQIWIDGVAADTNPCDTSNSIANIIDSGITAIYGLPQINGGVPCIKGAPQIVNVFVVPCFERVLWPILNFTAIFPCGTLTWCERTCQICFSATDQMEISNCSFNSVGTSSCSAQPSPYWFRWAIGTCFSIFPSCP